VPNPYFGIGLAVHEHLIICGHCDLGAFKPNGPRPDPNPKPDAEAERGKPRKLGLPWLRRGS
jgi:hypothetical protein